MFFYCQYENVSVQHYTMKKVFLVTEIHLWDTFIILLAPPGTEWQQSADRIREIRHP